VTIITQLIGGGGARRGEEGPGGGKLDGCIMHQVHTSFKKEDAIQVPIGMFKRQYVPNIITISWQKVLKYRAFFRFEVLS